MDKPERTPPSPAPVVTEPTATQILLDHGRRRYLEPFMRGERSTAEAADEVGVPVKDMAYRVQRMHRIGLLHLTAEQPRAGRAVRRYRAPTSFFVPFSVVPEPDMEEAFENLLRPLRARLLQGLAHAVTDTEWNVHDWGYRFELNEKGRVSVVPMARPAEPSGRIFERILQADAPAVYLSYVPLQLDFAHAKQLQRELIELVQRYQQEAGAGTYFLSVGLAPVEGGPGAAPAP
ncbi:MAG: hypothetical protein P8Y05_02435 [Deinococcales bacterium]